MLEPRELFFCKVTPDLQVLISKLGFHVIDILLDFLLLLQRDDEQGIVHIGDDIALKP